MKPLKRIVVGKIGEDVTHLKPCPFCGSRAELLVLPRESKGPTFTPRCTDTSCPGRCAKRYTVKVLAITKWNRREVYD